MITVWPVMYRQSFRVLAMYSDNMKKKAHLAKQNIEDSVAFIQCNRCVLFILAATNYNNTSGVST